MSTKDKPEGVTDDLVQIGAEALDSAIGRNIPSLLTRRGREDVSRLVLEAALPLSGVRVKPLAWRSDGLALTPVRVYRVQEVGSFWIMLVDGHTGSDNFNSEAEAKAAAQADYERHILSALEPQPYAEAVAPVAEGAGLEVALVVPGYPDVPLVRLTDAQSALAAKDGEIERIYDEAIDWRTQLQAAQTRVADLEKALKFYAASGTWQDDVAPDPAGTSIPYTSPAEMDRGDHARAALQNTNGGEDSK